MSHIYSDAVVIYLTIVRFVSPIIIMAQRAEEMCTYQDEIKKMLKALYIIEGKNLWRDGVNRNGENWKMGKWTWTTQVRMVSA